MSGGGDGEDAVVVLATADTHDLRRRILREGRIDASVTWPGDDDPETTHLGIERHREVIAISTWLPTELRVDGRLRVVQLRGMATEPAFAGTGLGGRLLRAGIARAAEQGAEVVWANARIGAVGFYEHAGFTTVGDVFTIADVGLPHRRVEHRLSTPPI